MLANHHLNPLKMSVVVGENYIEINTNFHVIQFYTKLERMVIIRKKNNKTFNMSFDEWCQNIRASLVQKMGFRESTFSNSYWPIFKTIFRDTISHNKQLKKTERPETTHSYLVPINEELAADNPSAYNQYLKDQKEGWFIKLMSDYNNLPDKSEIVIKHYQEQARIHGLKFVDRKLR